MSKIKGVSEEELKAALAAGSSDIAQGDTLKVHDFSDLIRTEMQLLADNEPNERYRSRYLKHLDKFNIKVKKQ